MTKVLHKFFLLLLTSSVNILFAQNLVDPVLVGGQTQLCFDDPACTTLSVLLLDLREVTNDYAIQSLPYVKTEVTNPISLPKDDEYSNVIDLPFQFCFFGNTYGQLVVGANGNISFDVSLADTQYEPEFNTSLPSSELPLNGVLGALHDIDPSVGGQVTYGVTGAAPFRAFVVSYSEVPHFSGGAGADACNELLTTQQIVLHESSNFIDVYLGEKPTCEIWNNGNAVVGIQNIDGTIGYAAPGRNTNDSPWTAAEEAWRFRPNGPLVPKQFNGWYDGNGNFLSNETDIELCLEFNEIVFVTARTNFDLPCPALSLPINRTVMVTRSDFDRTVEIIPTDLDCDGSSVTLTTDLENTANFKFVWSLDGEILEDEEGSTLGVTEPGLYSVRVTTLGCSAFDSLDVQFGPTPEIDLGGSLQQCSGGDPVILDASPSNLDLEDVSFQWYRDDILIVGETQAQLTVNAPNSGRYSVKVFSSTICLAEDEATVLFGGELPIISLPEETALCGVQGITLDATPTNLDPGTVSFQWSKDEALIEGANSATLVVTTSGTYSVEVSNGFCVATASTIVTNNETPETDLPSELHICINRGLRIDATPTNIDSEGLQYTWYKDNTVLEGESEAILQLPYASDLRGLYSVTINNNGCQNTYDILVSYFEVNQECQIPQGISPNGDGFNDTFNVSFLNENPGIKTISIRNRFGTEVFSMGGYKDEWFGQNKQNQDFLPVGTYFYAIELLDGSNVSGWIYLNK